MAQVTISYAICNICSQYKIVECVRRCLHDTGATFAPERVHSGSLSWLYICLHDIYHHKMSCLRESPRRGFTPVVVLGREFRSGTKSRNGICEIGLPVDWDG